MFLRTLNIAFIQFFFAALSQVCLAGESNLSDLIDEISDLGNKGQFGEAEDTINAQFELAKLEEDPKLQIKFYYVAALNAFNLSETERSLSLLEFALSKSRFLKMKEMEADILSAMSNVHWILGNSDRGIQLLETALEIRKEIGGPNNIASILNNLGIQYYATDQYEKSIDYYRSALLLLENNTVGRELRAKLTSNLAESLIQINELKEAEGLLYESLEIELSMGDAKDIAYTHFNLGEFFFKQNEWDMAKKSYNDALAIQRKIEHPYGQILTYYRLGETLKREGKLEESIQTLQFGLEIAIEIKAKVQIERFARLLSSIHSQVNDPAKEEFYRVVAQGYKQTYEENLPKQILKMDPTIESKPEFKEHRQENNKGDKFQKILILLLLIVLLFLACENRILRREDKKIE